MTIATRAEFQLENCLIAGTAFGLPNHDALFETSINYRRPSTSSGRVDDFLKRALL